MAEIESLATQEPLAKHLQRHRTDRLIMLSDGVFAIATTLAALEIRLPEHPVSLGALFGESGQSLVAYLLSFLFASIFWISSRELFARVQRTDNILTWLTLGLLCGIAVIPAAVHVFYTPGGLTVGFKFYCMVMAFCGAMNAGMWVYAAARPGVLRVEVGQRERWSRALPTVIMPILFLFCVFLGKDQIVWAMVPAAFLLFLIRRVLMPMLWPTKTVDSAA